MTINYNNRGNQFFIEIVPNITDKGKFTGEYYLQISARKTNIDKESYEKLEQICQLGCAALSLMEQEEDFKENLIDYMMSPPEIDNDNEPTKPTIKDITENVITLEFNKEIKH